MSGPRTAVGHARCSNDPTPSPIGALDPVPDERKPSRSGSSGVQFIGRCKDVLADTFGRPTNGQRTKARGRKSVPDAPCPRPRLDDGALSGLEAHTMATRSRTEHSSHGLAPRSSLPSCRHVATGGHAANGSSSGPPTSPSMRSAGFLICARKSCVDLCFSCVLRGSFGRLASGSSAGKRARGAVPNRLNSRRRYSGLRSRPSPSSRPKSFLSFLVVLSRSYTPFRVVSEG